MVVLMKHSCSRLLFSASYWLGWRLYVGSSSLASGGCGWAECTSVHSPPAVRTLSDSTQTGRHRQMPFCFSSIWYSERPGGFDILPYKSYKASIMASFVRQHNMYGLNKVLALHSGNLKVFLNCECFVTCVKGGSGHGDEEHEGAAGPRPLHEGP